MKNYYTFTHIADDTELDANLNVSLLDMVKLVQMSTLMHSDMIGLDHTTMQEKSNAFWVTSKIKIDLKNPVRSGDKMKIKTWVNEPSSVRVVRMNEVKVDGVTSAEAISEWCCLDLSTQKIRRINTVNYPELKMKEKRELNMSFSREQCTFNETNYIYTRTIRATDIDVNRHTNNLKYNQIALDALTMDELDAIKIKSYEIHFVNQSYEGEQIKVYKKRIDKNIFIEGKTQGKVIFNCILTCEK